MKKNEKLTYVQQLIDRPVLAWVMNIVLVLLGIVAYFNLPVRQYPRIDFPVVTVTTQYEGANPEVMETQVTRLLEDSFAGLEGLDLMSSVSSAEQSKITLKFQESRSIDSAAADVRDRLSRLENLPREATTPKITKADMDAGSTMSLALTSTQHSLEELHDYTMRRLKSEVESVGGVAYVENYGGVAYELHVVLDPDKMASLGVTPAEVSEAFKSQNFNRPAGRLGSKDQEFLVVTKAQLSSKEDFSNLVVLEKNDYLVRVSDIGYIKRNDRDTRFRVRYNGKDAVLLDVMSQSKANPVEISANVYKRLVDIRQHLPKGMKLEVAFDDSEYIKSSIDHVYQGIWEAIILVLLVVFFFLHSFRIALVPLITIPISLIGTFFVIYLLGFSINILSLLAMVLAVGLVVDDAIVVLENIYRHVEDGMSSFAAARKGIREIQFSIVGMTLTLVAVYLPVSLAQGLVGKLFTEFALTLAAAVLISGFVALVLSPTMCARLLTAPDFHATGHLQRFFVRVDAFFKDLDEAYKNVLKKTLGYSRTVFWGAAAFGVFGYVLSTYVPQEMSPETDKGVIKIYATGPFGATLPYLDHYAEKVDTLVSKIPYVVKRLLITQVGDQSFERAGLVPRSQRPGCKTLLPELKEDLRKGISGIKTVAFCPSGGFGGSSERPLSFVLQTDLPYTELVKMARRVRRLISSYPGVNPGMMDWNVPMEGKEYHINIKRNLAAASNVSLYALGNTLDIFSGRRVTSFERDSRMYPVKLMLDEKDRVGPGDLKRLMVKGRKDNKEVMVPLQDLVEITEKVSNPAINHYGRMRAATISAALEPGASLSRVYEGVNAAVQKMLPETFVFQPEGELRRFLKEQNTIAQIFLLALAFIFLVMAAQFESFRDPLIIMLSVPLALVGGIVTLFIVPGATLNVYSQIGLITLIGLITKHGILIVDFTNQKVREGVEVYQALVDACRLRLRPILMTTSAMVLGAVPLVLGTGAGVEARRQVGWVLIGGLTIGTFLTLFVVPCVYLLFSRYAPETLWSLDSADKKSGPDRADPL